MEKVGRGITKVAETREQMLLKTNEDYLMYMYTNLVKINEG